MQHKEIAMLHNYFQQKNLNPLADSFEKPVIELMELNMKTLQNFSYLMPNEILNIRRPEEAMEKNLELFIENSQTALTYMQDMFDIMEKHMLHNMDTAVRSTRDISATMRSTAASMAPERASTKRSTRSSGTGAKSKSSTARKASTTVHSASSASKKPSTSHASKSAQKSGVSTTAKSHNSSPAARSLGSTHHTSTTSSHAKPSSHSEAKKV